MYYTLKDMAQVAGLNERTVLNYLRSAGRLHAEPSKERRRWQFTEDDLEAVRAVKLQVEQERTRTAHAAYTQSTDGELAARVAALEATIEQLRKRAGWLFESRSAGNLAMVERLPTYVPPKRQMAATVRYKPNPALPPVPAHLMTIPQWCEQHGRSSKTVWHWMRVNKLPVVRGQWMEGMTRFEVAIDAAGREIAHQLAGIPWPCELCAAVEADATDNETPHPSDE